jgi:uncharacterized protein (TIGR03067 family)
MRLTIALAGCVLLAGADDKQNAKKDSDPLTGTWKVVSTVVDGRERDQAKGGMFFVFKDGKVTRKQPRGEAKATYKTDTSKKPATIDMTDRSDGMTRKGIFEVKGDELKLCIAWQEVSSVSYQDSTRKTYGAASRAIQGDAERPKTFAAEGGSGNFLAVLKKETGAAAEKADKGSKKAD